MLLKVFFLHSYCMHIKNDMYIYLDLFKAKIRSPSTRACDVMLRPDSHKVAAKSEAFSLTCSPGFLPYPDTAALLVLIILWSLVWF